MTDLPNRRPCVNVGIGERDGREMFVASVGFNPETGAPCEVFITARGKSGTDVDQLLYELGVSVSKIMQHE